MEMTKSQPVPPAPQAQKPQPAPEPPPPPQPPPALKVEPIPEEMKPMVLTFVDVQELGGALRKNLLTKEQLIKAVQDATSISVADVQINLDPRLLTRLKSRCMDKPNWERWLAEVVTRQLHDYAGY
jgi:hypothetical protein